MVKLNLFVKLAQSALLVSALVSVAACAPKNIDPFEAIFNHNEMQNPTGGKSVEGYSYTGSSNGDDLQKLRAAMAGTDEEIQFATSIEDIRAEAEPSRAHEGADVKVWVTTNQNMSSQTIAFAGISKEKEFSGLVPLLSGANYLLEVKCKSRECNEMIFRFSRSNTVIGAAIFRTTKRYVNVKTMQQTDLRKAAPQVLSSTISVWKLNSFEVVNGPARFTLSLLDKSASFAGVLISEIRGDLLETNGLCHPLQTLPADSGVASCLSGNTEDGEFVIKSSINENTFAWLTVKPDGYKLGATTTAKDTKVINGGKKDITAPKAEVSQAGPCGIKNLEKLHPLIQQIIGDCEHKEVQAMIKKHWLADKGFSISKFIRLFNDIKTSNPDSRAREFKTMLDIIHEKGMHTYVSLVTLIESGFNANLTSRTKAKGYWQLMPGTAKFLKLSLHPVDQRTQIAPATRAATSYLKSLLEDFPAWKGNYKIALAAYNCGPYNGGLRRASKAIERKADKDGVDLDEVSEEIQDAAMYSVDFWELYRKKMIPRESRLYVLRYLSGALITMDPAFYGIKNINAAAY